MDIVHQQWYKFYFTVKVTSNCNKTLYVGDASWSSPPDLCSRPEFLSSRHGGIRFFARHQVLMGGLAPRHQWSAAPSLGRGTSPHRLVCSTVRCQKSACPRYSSTYSLVRFDPRRQCNIFGRSSTIEPQSPLCCH